MNISLPESLKTWVEHRLSQGRYAGASDYVRDLIRRDQECADGLPWVQAMIDEGLASETLKEDALEVIDKVIADGRRRREAA